LLLVDEPTQGLAPIVARDIMQAVVAVARTGVGVLLVEQNAAMAPELADRAYVLDGGLIRAEGQAAEIRADDEVRRSYLAV
ncbi:MAG: ABC transporter ATP-binding protein, partial [Acidimicrobiaceae bacterium]|nr:ABC transporter ATP-binding protein [Acidimicrobiaceae bacterium]